MDSRSTMSSARRRTAHNFWAHCHRPRPTAARGWALTAYETIIITHITYGPDRGAGLNRTAVISTAPNRQRAFLVVLVMRQLRDAGSFTDVTKFNPLIAIGCEDLVPSS
jgi:hypothetical protein